MVLSIQLLILLEWINSGPLTAADAIFKITRDDDDVGLNFNNRVSYLGLDDLGTGRQHE
jgi:hypothetical protein